MRETNGLLTEELEGLQRKLGRQEKMQEALVDLELEKEVSSGWVVCPGLPSALSGAPWASPLHVVVGQLWGCCACVVGSAVSSETAVTAAYCK